MKKKSPRASWSLKRQLGSDQGPFEDYDSYGETHWQLLVQAVNHWYPDSQPLVEAFRFLPDWRFDDLMVSFATPSGGVGPHVDNYDVFIIQGEGERRWTVGANTPQQRRGGNPNSPLVEDFEPIIDVVLEKAMCFIFRRATHTAVRP